MRLVVGFVIIFFVSSCKQDLYQATTATDVNWTELKTYSFLKGVTSENYNHEIIQYRAVQKVNDQLSRRGFTLETENPDFLVRIHTLFDPFPNTAPNSAHGSMDEGFGLRFYFKGGQPAIVLPGDEGEALDYMPGTMAVELIDTTDGSQIWRGWSTDPISPSATPDELDLYLDQLFAKFPITSE